MGKPEEKVEAYLTKALTQRGFLVYKFTSPTTGVPDRLAIKDGMTHYFELKRDDGKGRLSARQIAVHRQFAKHGVDVHVFNSREQIDAWLLTH